MCYEGSDAASRVLWAAAYKCERLSAETWTALVDCAPGTPTRPLRAPFAGVTVWELGQVHRGTWAQRYWSSPGCLFHHAYPVGYRATKVQFGRMYEMAIEEGAAGPLFKVGRLSLSSCKAAARQLQGSCKLKLAVNLLLVQSGTAGCVCTRLAAPFRHPPCLATAWLCTRLLAPQVTDQQSGVVFTGSSPTKPWTEICIAHRTGQRISGPLFFGFSDPLTQRAIAANLYSKEELRAVLQARRGGGIASPGRGISANGALHGGLPGGIT